MQIAALKCPKLGRFKGEFPDLSIQFLPPRRLNAYFSRGPYFTVKTIFILPPEAVAWYGLVPALM